MAAQNKSLLFELFQINPGLGRLDFGTTTIPDTTSQASSSLSAAWSACEEGSHRGASEPLRPKPNLPSAPRRSFLQDALQFECILTLPGALSPDGLRLLLAGRQFRGRGRNKKDAEQAAAAQAVDYIVEHGLQAGVKLPSELQVKAHQRSGGCVPLAVGTGVMRTASTGTDASRYYDATVTTRSASPPSPTPVPPTDLVPAFLGDHLGPPGGSGSARGAALAAVSPAAQHAPFPPQASAPPSVSSESREQLTEAALIDNMDTPQLRVQLKQVGALLLLLLLCHSATLLLCHYACLLSSATSAMSSQLVLTLPSS